MSVSNHSQNIERGRVKLSFPEDRDLFLPGGKPSAIVKSSSVYDPLFEELPKNALFCGLDPFSDPEQDELADARIQFFQTINGELQRVFAFNNDGDPSSESYISGYRYELKGSVLHRSAKMRPLTCEEVPEYLVMICELMSVAASPDS